MRLIEALADVMLFRGIAENIRSVNGPEFVAKELRQWLAKVGGADVVYRGISSQEVRGRTATVRAVIKLRDE